MNSEIRNRLLGILRELSAADLSILQAAAQQLRDAAPVLLTTVPDSANDRLWAAMTEAGLMNQADPLDVPVSSKVYRVDPSASEAIGELLAEHAHRDVMVKLVNELRERIPALLIEDVHSADGTPFDLAMILGGIVESTMRRAIKPHLHDEVLQEVAKLAQNMRTL